MYLNTNLGFGFRKYEDLLCYMKENKLDNVEVKVESDIFGVSLPSEKMSLNDVVNHIKEVENLV